MLLLKEGNENIFRQGLRYYVTDKNKIVYEFTLTHTLVPRYKLNLYTQAEEIVYAVIDEKEESIIGKGAYGVVYPVIGTLHVTGGIKFKKHARHIAKVMSAGYKSYFAAINKECRNLIRLPHIQTKTTLALLEHSEYDIRVYNIFKKFEGVPLSTLIKNGDIDKLSTLTKLKLITRSLHSLKEQFHYYRMIHCDIKPDNIIVNLPNLEVNYIDVGGSEKIRTRSNVSIGTLLYSAPEILSIELKRRLNFLSQPHKDKLLAIFEKALKELNFEIPFVIDESIDVASLTWVLAEVLGFNLQEIITTNGEIDQLKLCEFYLSRLDSERNLHYFDFESFSRLDMDKNYKSAIINQLSLMQSLNRINRQDINTLIIFF